MSRRGTAPDHSGAIVVAMRRALTLILGVALFGILAAVVVASQGADDPAGTTGTVTETVERTTTVEDNPNRVRDDNDAAEREDVRGPCDEAEHANDPECTDVPTVPGDDDDRVDNSGPGSLNSGPGNAEDDGEIEDHSGPGHGGDDDSSGPGSGDDDSSGSGGGDSSGHGSGDDD